MTKYPDPNKKYYKKIPKEVRYRNRKIVDILSKALLLIGGCCIFLFSGTRIECELPWVLLIIGCVLILLSSLGFRLLDSTNGGNK